MTFLPSVAPGAEPPSLPPLETLLAQAVDGHPKIVAAKAKVALAEARLREIQFQVAQEIIDMDAERTGLVASLQLAKTTLQFAETQFKTGRGLQAELVAAQKGVLDVQTRLAKVELQLRQIVGSVGNAAARPGGAMASPTALEDTPEPEDPRDVETTVGLLGNPCKLEFSDVPLSEVAMYLQDYMGKNLPEKSRFLVDEGLGDTPVSIQLPECKHLVEAIQALEDKYPKIKFVVREYGLFVTTPQRARKEGLLPAIDFWRQHSSEYQPIAKPAKPDGGGAGAKPAASPQPAAKPATKAAPATSPAEKPATNPSRVISP